MHPLSPTLVPAALLGLTGLAGAQIGLSGSVYDGNGGPLTAGNVYIADTNLSVPAGETLTIDHDVVLKFKTGIDWRISLDGTLVVNGTASQPTTFTSILDDTVGGDTGADGPTVGAPGSWAGIIVGDDGLLDATELEVRFAGRSGWSSIWTSGGSLDLTDCRIADGGNSGIDFNQQDTPLTSIQGCSITGCETLAMEDVPIDVIEGIKNNTASGNGIDAIQLNGATGLVVDGDVTIGPENCLNGALLFRGVLSSEPGSTLTFKAGAVIKMLTASSTRWSLEGTLRIEGTASDPVVFTAADDDDYGGDTLGDGATVGAPGTWAGIEVNAGAVFEAEHWIQRFGGKSESTTVAPIWARGGSLTLRSSEMRDNLRSALDLEGTIAPIVVEDCAFNDNAEWAVVDAPLEVLAGFLDNTATGNGEGDTIRLFGVVNGVAEISPRNLLGGVMVFTNQINVQPGGSLTLNPGVVVKSENDRLNVRGSLHVRGTAIEPVVFTSLSDDLFGGDTNADGPSTGAVGEWPGLRLEPEASASTIEHALVRFAGSTQDAVWIRSPLVSLNAVRVEHSGRDGFQLDDAASAANLVAWNSALQGIDLNGGSFDLVHATAAQNGATGIDHGGFYSGVIRNSVAWGNGGAGNYTAVSAGDLVFSNGDAALAGVDGNLNADPLFVDGPGGDLRLQLASPCLDVADNATALAVLEDAAQNSRILPADLGPAVADMGAFERARWTLTASGSAAAGELLTLGIDGEDAGIGYFAFGQLDAVAFFDPFGIVLAGLATLKPLPNPIAIGGSLSFPVPDVPALYGTEFGMQGVGISTDTVGLIHYTNLYRSRFEPPLL